MTKKIKLISKSKSGDLLTLHLMIKISLLPGLKAKQLSLAQITCQLTQFHPSNASQRQV